jgi:hypothetical protein
MRLLVSLAMLVVLVLGGAMAFMWVREGSFEEAGREVDQELGELVEEAGPTGERLEALGEAAVDTVGEAARVVGERTEDAANEAAQDAEQATDGDDRN